MNWFRSLRRSTSDPSPSPVSRRRFFAGAGAAAGAAAGSMLFGQPAWAGGAQGPDLGIEPGTLVDAQGRPMKRAPMISEPFVGMIALFGFNYPPRGWAFCQGQLLAIASNNALYSLLGTMYGGNGTTHFALPDLRGRVPVGHGQGPGLPNYSIGQQGGAPTHTLSSNEMPQHTHAVGEVQVRGTGTQGLGAASGGTRGGATNTVVAGGSQPHNNMQPYLGLNYSIALQGLFPTRN